ncbi:hypothetical protein LF1_12790 [Rubripirellula obstinata]|uniref:Xylose isomerase-like TIM barrel n=1 Tax=Rubripirellula obstinata TaxID=406547 RepID=A0A5B1CDU2_9BACT|nr:metabolite traffic protein EboE [Rubripirellula obstinata]KAA1258756.1 hypothetical protein LF1_12790 [Rubripirellula obstinata]
MISPTKWTTGYCTNVHAGTDMASIRENLDRYAGAARMGAGLDSLGVGLWLPASAAKELAASVGPFKEFLAQRSLTPYTINGFPYDNFHQDVVKQTVYRPGWWEPSRRQYTEMLAEILSQLLSDDQSTGSISTLPIGWPTDCDPSKAKEASGEALRTLAKFLSKLESKTGKRIVVAIEPEPGCMLDTTEDVVDFFANELPESMHRRHIAVCHDVCHSAVMMESQAVVIDRLATEGIGIGKVQISSAVVADWQAMAEGRRREAITQLSQFAEDRYLHQTGRVNSAGKFMLSEDLPNLLAKVATDGDPVWGDHRWVVHFHMPIFIERFGHLCTSQSDILQCLTALAAPGCKADFTGHLEIETYAWSVLPESMRKRGLADDIASEVRWLRRAIVEAM